jgi:structural maintenance of chromosome 1
MSLTCRKASASVLAVDERQSLETLTRDEKTASRSLAQLREKHQDLDQKKDKLSEDARIQSERKSEVRFELLE